MAYLIIVGLMLVVGVIMGFVAGLIWKDNRPIGVSGDFIASIITCVVVGLLDWIVVPALGFSKQLALIALAMEPAASALLVLWIIRKVKK
ncbi:MAG: hypothetical protein JEZ06_19100 [Anaerolineaceae bacterium]|nr:hypothetical protein [Anaerolineaceae bacterium]